MLLYSVKPLEFAQVAAQRMVDLARQVPLQASHDLRLRESLRRTLLDICPGARAAAHPHDHRHVQRPVRLATPSPAEAMSGGATARRGHGGPSAQPRTA